MLIPSISLIITCCCCTKAFCGILDRVREVSLYFENSTLGMHLVPAAAAVRPGTSSQRANQDQEKNKKSYIAPAIISSIQDTEACRVCYSSSLCFVRHVLHLFYTTRIFHIVIVPLPYILSFVLCPLSLSLVPCVRVWSRLVMRLVE